MATSSYANLFGTTGAGRQGSKAGISTLFGQQETVRANEDEMERQRKQAAGQPTQTFAQMQAAGQARPPKPAPAQAAPSAAPMMSQLQSQLGRGAPAAPAPIVQMAPGQEPILQATPSAPPQPAATGMGAMAPMPGRPGAPMAAPMAPAGVPGALTSAGVGSQLQQQIMQMLQSGGYSDAEYQQLRQAQLGNLQAEYGAEQQRLNEELARRGLSSSSIGAGRMGDLAGQQARAMAGLEGQLLQQQAEMRQRSRETGLGLMSDLTRTLATTEQQAAETRLKEQLGMSEIAGVLYKRDENGNLVPATDADQQQIKTLAAQEVARRLGIAEAEVTGMFGGRETLPAQTQRQQLALQLAQALAGSDDPDVLKSILPYMYQAFGITPPATND